MTFPRVLEVSEGPNEVGKNISEICRDAVVIPYHGYTSCLAEYFKNTTVTHSFIHLCFYIWFCGKCIFSTFVDVSES